MAPNTFDMYQKASQVPLLILTLLILKAQLFRAQDKGFERTAVMSLLSARYPIGTAVLIAFH